MKSTLAFVLCILLAAPGCATSRMSSARFGPPASPASQRAVPMDARLMAEYVRQLPVGARVRVSLTNGSVLRGTLMKRDADPIVVQRRTRIPEEPVEIAVADIAAMELETSNGSVGRNVGIAAGAAVAATLGVLLMLAAIYSD
jgi:hypothetical protein